MKKICPLLKEECLEQGCNWYTHLTGANPQTGAEMDKFGCAVEWLPILLVETAKEVRHSRAAIEVFKNEMAEANKNNPLLSFLNQNTQPILPEG